MGRSLPIFAFLVIAAVVAHAALPSQVYWNTVLPNTPMPGAIRELLHPDVLDEKAGTSVSVGKGSGVNVHTGKGKSGGGTTVGVGKGSGVNVHTGKGKSGGGTTVGVGKGGVGVVTGPKKKPVVVNVKPGKSPFAYKYAATEDQIHDDPDVALFFLEKNLQPGTNMNLHFTRTTSGATFLPRGTANSIPFSSNKLPEILTRFSIQSDSQEAGAMKQTLEECEAPADKGETRYCATSLESMVDYTTSALGTRDVRAWSTEVDKEGTPKQQYTIASSGVEKLAGDKTVACHAQTYAYAVFNCHQTRATKAYMVPLVGKDGTKAEAVAVCHTDTSTWNPKHVAFQVLKVKPGTVPVCHFLPQDHIIWTPTSS